MSAPDPSPVVRVPADLIAAVPYLLGFHPTDSLVAVGVSGRRLTFTARVDLPRPDEAPELAQGLAAIVERQDMQGVILVGYGVEERVEPALDEARLALAAAGMPVYEALRVTDGRYWCSLCTNAACCPPEGVPFDPVASPVAAAFTYAGEVALPDRDALAAQVAPVGSLTRVSMQQATARAYVRLQDLIEATLAGREAGTSRARAVRAALGEAGGAALAGALARHAEGGRLIDDEVAWLTVLLDAAPAPETAGRPEQIPLWTDVVQRVEEELAAPVATLLALSAWRDGRGGLASVALDRALGADPAYEPARLLEEALGRGLAPLEWSDGLRSAPPSRRRRRGGRRRRVRS